MVPVQDGGGGRPGATAAGELVLRDGELARLQRIALEEAGLRLDDSKRLLLVARLGPRLRELGLSGFPEYLVLLESRDPRGEELRVLIDRITTNTTRFFREEHHFELLARELSAIRHGPVRVWSSACSTGEEVYSIAMTAVESLGPLDAASRLVLVGSDVDRRALARAEAGVYAADRLGDLSPDRLRRHFLRGVGAATGRVRVKPELRRLVDLRRINLAASAWPELRPFDVVFCRNALIYFERERARRILERLAALVRPGGLLVLGHSESLPRLSVRFEALGGTVFRRASVGAAASSEPPREARRTIFAGDVLVSPRPLVVRTLLGSCVAACLYDPGSGVGGVNHFALPTPAADGDLPSSRYGVHAMERLINGIMRLGGDRRRLRAKLFGASRVLGLDGGSVADANLRFVRTFVETEGIPVVGDHLGGSRALELLFQTSTGRAWARAVASGDARSAIEREASYRREIEEGPRGADVTLFAPDAAGAAGADR